MEYKVRRAKEKDIAAIMELLLQVNMVHHTGRPDIFKGPTTKFNEEDLKSIIADDLTPVFVCTDNDDKAVGHAFCEHQVIKDHRLLQDIKTLYIDDICVDENQREHKIGRRLYEHVLSYARENGFYNITLNVWECNPTARKFYEAMGLVPQKTVMETLL